MNIPLFDFKATTYLKAFVLTSIVSSMSAVIAVEIKSYSNYLQNISHCDKLRKTKGFACYFFNNNFLKILGLIIGTFILTLLSHLILFLLFGYGGGMIASPRKDSHVAILGKKSNLLLMILSIIIFISLVLIISIYNHTNDKKKNHN